MADPNTPRYSNDERLTEAQREQYDAAHHALRGTGGGGGGGMSGGGGGAAAAVMAPLIIVGTFVVFMLYACFYPMAAGVALLVAILVSKTFDAFVPGVGWIMHYLMVLPLGFAALMMYRQREWKLELKPAYLKARHVLRLVFTAVIVSTTAMYLTETGETPGDPLDEPLNWTHFAIVATSLVIVHFVGRWLDRRTLVMLADVGLLDDAPSHAARTPSRASWPLPGLNHAPATLAMGLPVMALAGGTFGAFLGYAAFETSIATLIGLLTGCLGGAMLMFVCWVITRPVGALFDRLPLLWPLMMGGIVGAAIAWRLALADKASLATYLAPGIVGGALALAAPYLLYTLVRGHRRTA